MSQALALLLLFCAVEKWSLLHTKVGGSATAQAVAIAAAADATAAAATAVAAAALLHWQPDQYCMHRICRCCCTIAFADCAMLLAKNLQLSEAGQLCHSRQGNPRFAVSRLGFR